MSRQIDADRLYEVIKNSWDTSDAEDFEKSVFVALATAPTIEQRKTGKWIPCSETVDIPDHEVLACDKYGEYLVGLLAYEDEQWLCESEETMMYDPIAWMPLPEIYRGEQE